MANDRFYMPEMRRIEVIHFVGIGGAGMSGIAEVLANLGYQVTGSDANESATVERLRSQGVTVYIGHDANHVNAANVVVVSSAINHENPEVRFANDNRIPVVPRAEMLAELMRFRHGIAVAGTHGKSTTTSMVASIMGEAGLDPTFVVGGLVRQSAVNAQLGQSRYLIAEADESDASFMHLQPMTAVVTNIDADHMSTYGGDFSRLQQTFVEFLHNLPFYGLAVLCIDDPNLEEIFPRINRSVLTYGFDERADFWIRDCRIRELQTELRIQRPEGLAELKIELGVPGRHNALNAAAAVAVATDEGVSDEHIVAGLKKFEGVERRFEVLGEYSVAESTAMLVDDYGHHPREVAATIGAIRDAFPDRRLFMIFQPHRYTRTSDLYDDFVQVLSSVDQLIVTEVYPAGEEVIPGADGRSLCRSIRQRGMVDPIFVEDIEEIPDLVADLVQPNDLVITQGAGNVSRIARLLKERELR
jgi:UDP-N-acetylmuramate--alanine ligase